MAVTITQVQEKSPAARKKIAAGDVLLRMNGHEIEDVLDYRFYLFETKLTLELETPKGSRTVRIRKAEDEELGLEFETYLMDKQRSCRNRCIFCFIDQLPLGLRDTLYFKDDDSRLSFLFGNYITLTNLTEHEVERIISMHISPVNVSVHTTNPELRCRMMNNRFAGESLKILRRLADAHIDLNAQLVLCPEYNDGDELTRSMEDLATYFPSLQSVAAVPVGLTRYRDGLTPLRLFTKDEAADVIDRMNAMNERMLAEHGVRLFYPSDEFYLLAGREIPPADEYGDFLQLENGVGMWALFWEQFKDALAGCDETPRGTHMTLATGKLAAPLMEKCVALAREKWPNLRVEVACIRNDFFGETITVTGLVTGGDIKKQLTGRCGEILLLPSSMLRREGDCFLDDVTVEDLARDLHTKIEVTGGGGAELLQALLL